MVEPDEAIEFVDDVSPPPATFPIPKTYDPLAM